MEIVQLVRKNQRFPRSLLLHLLPLAHLIKMATGRRRNRGLLSVLINP
jgi:hypothetical protein